METSELKKIASQVRRDIVRMVSAVNSVHPGGSLGCADFLTVLYFDVMNHNNDFSMDAVRSRLFEFIFCNQYRQNGSGIRKRIHFDLR